MPVLVGDGGRLIRRDGTPSVLPRPSVPLAQWDSAGSTGVSVRFGDASVTVNYATVVREQPAVFTAVGKLTRVLSSLPLKTYVRDANGDKRRVQGDALDRLLRRPAPRMTTHDLVEGVGRNLFTFGNALLVKVRPGPGRPPDGLVVAPWPCVEPHTDDTGRVEGWVLRARDRMVWLDPEEVVHVAWRAPDSELGVSPLQPLAVTIALEEAAQRYAVANFRNAVRPSGAFVLPADAKLTREQRDELRRELRASHDGVDNAFRMMLLSGGASWQPMSQNAEEAELVAQRKRSREEIAALFDLHPSALGDTSAQTFNNMVEANRSLYEQTLLPHCTMIAERLQAQLIDPERAFPGRFVEFDFAERLRGDREKEIQALTAAVAGGLMTVNEARRALNLNRQDTANADRVLVPVNNLQPLASLPEGPATPAGTDPAAPGDPGQPE